MNRVKIKICGITRPEDAALCRELGADLVGVIFAGGPRRVTPERAALIGEAAAGARLVGVFAGASAEEIEGVARRAGLRMAQLHGKETSAFCALVAARTGLPVIKALTPPFSAAAAPFRNASPSPLSAAPPSHGTAPSPSAAAPPHPGAAPPFPIAETEGIPFLLFDLEKGRPAGRAEIEALRAAAARTARSGRKVLLSGGLDPDNVGRAVEEVAPYGVDVCRGVERSPGIKDPVLVERFIMEVKHAGR